MNKWIHDNVLSVMDVKRDANVKRDDKRDANVHLKERDDNAKRKELDDHEDFCGLIIQHHEKLISFETEFKELLKSFIVVHSTGVVDILNGKSISQCNEVERTLALKRYLQTIEISADTTVLVEHQPQRVGHATVKSVMVGHQLLYHYADYNPVLMNPREKNKFYFGEMSLQKYIGEMSSQYAARKKQSKMNFLHLLKTLDMMHLLIGVKKKSYDDIADAWMQILAFVRMVK